VSTLSGEDHSLSQDNNPTVSAREHSAKGWAMMLATLKKFLEGKRSLK
jgi:hypothetical protein